MTTEHEKHHEVLRNALKYNIWPLVGVPEAITYLLAATEKPAEVNPVRKDILATSSIDYWQQRGYLGEPEEWRRACELYRIRCNAHDCETIAKLHAHIEEGLLVVTRPQQQPAAIDEAVERDAAKYQFLLTCQLGECNERPDEKFMVIEEVWWRGAGDCDPTYFSRSDLDKALDAAIAAKRGAAAGAAKT